jgi:hypothetical protein
MVPDDAMSDPANRRAASTATREGLVEGVNLLLTRQDDWLQV